MTDLVQAFLERMERAEVEGRNDRPPLVRAPDPAPDAPTEAEYIAAWRETVMPDFDEYDGSCGCGDQECAGAC